MAPLIKGLIVSLAADKIKQLLRRRTEKSTTDFVSAEVKKQLERKPAMDLTVTGLIRHAAQFAAGALVTRGLIDGAGVELIVGAVTSVAAAGIYLFNRYRTK